MCLVNSYSALTARTQREQATIENLSSLGLYMDGDTGNSDYDLLTDIQKINSVIFSQDIKYEGATNTSSKSFANLLAGK